MPMILIITIDQGIFLFCCNLTAKVIPPFSTLCDNLGYGYAHHCTTVFILFYFLLPLFSLLLLFFFSFTYHKCTLLEPRTPTTPPYNIK